MASAQGSIGVRLRGFTLQWRRTPRGWLMTMTDEAGQDLGAWLLAPSVAGVNGSALPLIASAMADIAHDEMRREEDAETPSAPLQLDRQSRSRRGGASDAH